MNLTRVWVLVLFVNLNQNIAYASSEEHEPKASQHKQHDEKSTHEEKKIVHEKVVFDETNTITMPLGCLTNNAVPCVFKSLNRQTLHIGEVQLTVLAGAVVKISGLDPVKQFEPMTGAFIVDKSTKPIRVKSHELAKFPSYAIKTKDQVEVIDGKDFYLIKFNQDEIERVLLDKSDFVTKLAVFFNNKQLLRIKLKEISVAYHNSFKKDVALQKQIIQRQIASVEEQKQAEAERKAHELAQKKKAQQYFFKRTFER